MDAALLTWYLLPGNCRKNVVSSFRMYSWSNKGIWCSQPTPAFEHFMQIWLPSHFYCHTIVIPYWCVCSSCQAGSQCSSFPVDVGLKQGCVLAPIIFNLFLVVLILVSHHDLSNSVGVEFHLDGGLFELLHLQSKTKTSSALISALQYADDAAFCSLTEMKW